MEEYEYIINKFIQIYKKRWIKGVGKDNNNVGITFEHELGKQPDSMFFPDFYGIEIKCSQRYSNFPISLFSLAFDGPYLFTTNELIEKYGRLDKNSNKKIINKILIPNKFIKINSSYYFKLMINKELKKLYIEVYDKDYNYIEEAAFIYFETLNDRINLKLSKVAYIRASRIIKDNTPYFRYYQLNILKLKSANTFINLLEKGYINVQIIGRRDKNGKNKNKGVTFLLEKNNIPLLFDRIFFYDLDDTTISFSNFETV